MTQSTLATAPDSASAESGYSENVNPQWVRLLSLLEMNVCYTRCVGAELFTADGTRILDFSPAIAFTTWAITIPA